MHKRAFQALKRIFIHVSFLTPPYFDKRHLLYKMIFSYKNMVGEDLRHA